MLPRNLEEIKVEDMLTKRQVVMSSLVEPFMEEKLEENIYLETVSSLLTKEMMPSYINSIIGTHLRYPRHAIDGSRLP